MLRKSQPSSQHYIKKIEAKAKKWFSYKKVYCSRGLTIPPHLSFLFSGISKDFVNVLGGLFSRSTFQWLLLPFLLMEFIKMACDEFLKIYEFYLSETTYPLAIKEYLETEGEPNRNFAKNLTFSNLSVDSFSYLPIYLLTSKYIMTGNMSTLIKLIL